MYQRPAQSGAQHLKSNAAFYLRKTKRMLNVLCFVSLTPHREGTDFSEQLREGKEGKTN